MRHHSRSNKDPLAAVYTARLTHLRKIAENEGGQDALARRLGVSQPCISQLIGKNPERNISERTARRIERLLQLPIGSLDPVGDEHLVRPEDNRVAEAWRPVPGYEATYEVSSLGRVRSLPRLTTRGRHLKGKILRCTLCNNGYYSVYLAVDGKVKRFGVSKLVARAFIPNPQELPEIHRIDGDPANNSVDNLEWVTRAETMRRAVLAGRMPKGEGHGLHKLTAADVRSIRSHVAAGQSAREIGRRFNVSESTVRSIAVGRTWGHIV
ncbi:NUMOD4 motif [Achromobacter xylosoxidans]|uniref:NUMOD4 domain-containing protein n=1 Tax=Alcaligenes xylosoxydans xylosoxydans TaxID=85698 RepID=UPI0006C25B8C|nr:NUMOD4 domain-containing protein [Achromobacter xylosoxidans]CUI38514.1 NUMOD4 motif [Achromobacter xylosoxidans]